MELLYKRESKSILFRLSLRALPRSVTDHSLLVVKATYINTLTQQRETVCERMRICRPAMEFSAFVPQSIDKHLNRYAAATTITEAIELSRNFEFKKAQEKLAGLIEKVQSSVSGPTDYCEDLAKDLNDCAKNMSDVTTFKKGVHFAHACSSMYFMERSTGLKSVLQSNPSLSTSNIRHLSYGYTTPEQECEAQKALQHTLAYFSIASCTDKR